MVARLCDKQQWRLVNTALDTNSDDFRKGIKPLTEVLHTFPHSMAAIDVTIQVSSLQTFANALGAHLNSSGESSAAWARPRPVCDVLVVKRHCPADKSSTCTWDHNQDAAAEI